MYIDFRCCWAGRRVRRSARATQHRHQEPRSRILTRSRSPTTTTSSSTGSPLSCSPHTRTLPNPCASSADPLGLNKYFFEFLNHFPQAKATNEESVFSFFIFLYFFFHFFIFSYFHLKNTYFRVIYYNVRDSGSYESDGSSRFAP